MPGAFVHVVAGAGFEPTTSGSLLGMVDISTWPDIHWRYDPSNSTWHRAHELRPTCQLAGMLACPHGGILSSLLAVVLACWHAVTPAGGNTLRAKVLSCCSPIALCYCRSLLDGKTRYADGNCDFAPKVNDRHRSTHGSAISAASRATSTPTARPTSALTTSSSGAARRNGHLRPATDTTQAPGCSSAGGLPRTAAPHLRQTPSPGSGATPRRRDQRPRTSSTTRSRPPRHAPNSSSGWLPNSAYGAAKSPRFTAVTSPNPPTVGRSQFTEKEAAHASSQSPPPWPTQSAMPATPGSSLAKSTATFRPDGSQSWLHRFFRRAGRSTRCDTGSPPPPTGMAATTFSESSKRSATARSRPLSATRQDHRTRSEQ